MLAKAVPAVGALEEKEPDRPDRKSALERGDNKNLYLALLEGQLGNAATHLMFRFIVDPLSNTNTGATTLHSISKNLGEPWLWDGDVPFSNQFLHPYHGSFSHTAARSNGFSFYESLFFNATASIVWEIAGETKAPSLNDVIITTVGGAAAGEMLHRLYRALRSPVRVALSPIGALDDLIKRKDTRGETNSITQLSTSVGIAFLATNDGITFNKVKDNMPNQTFLLRAAADIVYGDPFTSQSKVPFSQFELKLRAGGPSLSRTVRPWFSLTLLSSGYLFAFNPLNTIRDALSTGLTLDYDILGMGTIDSEQSALNWTVKWRHFFTNTAFTLKAQAGWTALGSSYYFDMGEGAGWGGVHTTTNYSSSFGTGANIKLHFGVENRAGTFEFDIISFFYYAIPLQEPIGGGFESISAGLLSYTFYFTETISLFVEGMLFVRKGIFFTLPDDFKLASELSLSVKWTFGKKDL